MNSHPKLVFSTTLAGPLAWNNAQLARRGPAEEIRALKTQPGDPLRSIGSITLVRHLMTAGLLHPPPHWIEQRRRHQGAIQTQTCHELRGCVGTPALPNSGRYLFV
jgi:hypothetical protein